MADASFSFSEISGFIALIGFLGTVVGGGIAIGSLKQQLMDTTDVAKKARDKALKNEADLAAFKTDAAKDYISRDHLSEVETRLVAEIDKFGVRMERFSDRIDRLLDAKAAQIGR